MATRMPICGPMLAPIAVAVDRSELGNQVSDSRGPPPKKMALLVAAINCPSRSIQ